MRALRPRTFVWSLSSWSHLCVVLLAAGLTGSLLALEALRIAGATTLGESDNPQVLETALSLDPPNAEIYHRLGMLRYYSSSQNDLVSAREALRRATELNPNEALYWSDLASACESSGDTDCADRAVEHALDLSPMTPRICWVAANYYLRSHRQQRALALFRRLLQLDTRYAEPTFQLCLRALGSPRPLLEDIVGPSRNRQVELAFVNFLSAHGDDDSAYAAWRRLAFNTRPAVATPLPALDLTSIAPYLNHLIDRGRGAEALAVWADLEGMHLIGAPADEEQRRAAMPPSNLVFNSGFEQNPLNWGFDWRYQPPPLVALGLSKAAVHGGTRCLRLEFTVPANEEFEPIYQVVPADPNESYILSAFVRSESITSDSGPRLRVVDLFCAACTNVATESTVGTTLWHQVQVSFSTGPQSHFVKISLWRPRSRSFPPEITGQFWLDDVSLTAVNSPENAVRIESQGPRSPVRVAALH
jgi:Flp pilus assembly protein TadD